MRVLGLWANSKPASLTFMVTLMAPSLWLQNHFHPFGTLFPWCKSGGLRPNGSLLYSIGVQIQNGGANPPALSLRLTKKTHFTRSHVTPPIIHKSYVLFRYSVNFLNNLSSFIITQHPPKPRLEVCRALWMLRQRKTHWAWPTDTM
jgi:hypothetical protein